MVLHWLVLPVIGACLYMVACAPVPAFNFEPISSTSPTSIISNPATRQSLFDPMVAPHFRARVGWAYEAYPEATLDSMIADMMRMRSAGANSIWLGHNNPGEVDASKVEPGLSFAVYHAIEFENGDKHSQALAMAGGIKRALDSARRVGLRVVLPIGYQIMMGGAWNSEHPDALRRTFDGDPLRIYSSHPTASPYSAQYRSDIARYYAWIDREWVQPYRDTVEMLSLADEPLGGDYSASAQVEFEKQYGVKMTSLAAGDEWKIGKFEAGVIVDYATWSADQWRRLNPNIPVTISFDGGVGRHHPGLPEIERLFAETPDNLILTFDAYLHDDLPNKPVVNTEIAELELFLSTIGHYSRIYHKPLALWAGVNSWGLAQESSAPRDIIDAIDNMFRLIDIPARVGGDLRAVYAWNYNVKGQGIYNNSSATSYDPGQMEVAVDRSFIPLRTRLINPGAHALEVVVLASPRDLYDKIQSHHSSDIPPVWFDIPAIANLAQDKLTAIVTPGPTLEATANARVFIVALKSPDVDATVKTFLLKRLGEGKIVMAASNVASAFDSPQEYWREDWKGIPTIGGSVYIVGSR